MVSEENDIFPQGNAKNNSSKKNFQICKGSSGTLNESMTQKNTFVRKIKEYFNKKWDINFI